MDQSAARKESKVFHQLMFSLVETLLITPRRHICLKPAVIFIIYPTIAALCNKHATSNPKYITDFSGNVRLSSAGSKGHLCRLLLIDFDPCC